MIFDLKRIEKYVFGIFEKRVILIIYCVIDYFRDLKICVDLEFFLKGGGVEFKVYFWLFN